MNCNEKLQGRAIASLILLFVSILLVVGFLILAFLVTDGFYPNRDLEGIYAGLSAVIWVFLGFFLIVIGAVSYLTLSTVGFILSMAALRVRPIGLRIAVISASVLHGIGITLPLGTILSLLAIYVRGFFG